MAAMVKRSSQVALNHCPNVGREPDWSRVWCVGLPLVVAVPVAGARRLKRPMMQDEMRDSDFVRVSAKTRRAIREREGIRVPVCLWALGGG